VARRNLPECQPLPEAPLACPDATRQEALEERTLSIAVERAADLDLTRARIAATFETHALGKVATRLRHDGDGVRCSLRASRSGASGAGRAGFA
jgi:hypothetical protein